ILQCDAAPCPISFGAIAMNVNQAAEFSVLRWPGLLSIGFHNRVMLRFRDQAIAQTARGVLDIRITHTEREIVCALVVLHEYVEVAFGSCAITFAHLVCNRTEAEPDAIRAQQSFI